MGRRSIKKVDTDRILTDVTGRYARSYQDAVSDLLYAIATGDRVAAFSARERIQEVVTETMGIGEIVGAVQTLQHAARLDVSDAFRDHDPFVVNFAEAPTQSVLPRVTFEQAVADMVERTPVTIRSAAERTAQRIAQLYGEDHVVAFARSAEDAVTRRAQSLIEEVLREGSIRGPDGGRLVGETRIGEGIKLSVRDVSKRTGAWTEAYSRMAFRTNFGTAVSAGRFRQASDPAIRKVIPAFAFVAVGDSDTRDNHAAADGLIFRVDNPVWNQIAPPLGYHCRCSVRYVSIVELRRAGRVDADGSIREDRLPMAAHPDSGFRHSGRPDLFMTGAA